MGWRRGEWVVVLALAACGPDGDDGDAAAGSGGAAEAVAGDGSEASASANGEGTCQVPAFPSAAGTEVTLHVDNATDDPIFVRRGVGLCFVEIDASDGVAGSVVPRCAGCEALVSGNGGCACPPEGWCTIPDFTRIEPGMRYSESWDGYLWGELEMPACAACADFDSCEASFAAPEGAYRVEVEVFVATTTCESECECDEGSDGPGWCTVSGPQLEREPRTIELELDHPNQTELVVVVE